MKSCRACCELITSLKSRLRVVIHYTHARTHTELTQINKIYLKPYMQHVSPAAAEQVEA